MYKIIQIVLMVSALIWASPADAKCGGSVWLTPPPAITYSDAPLRFHFSTDYENNCWKSIDNMNGTSIQITLNGESSGRQFKVNSVFNGLEFIQDLTPVDGWTGVTDTSISLSKINSQCYPPGDPLNFKIISDLAPIATKIAVTLKSAWVWSWGQIFLRLKVEPADSQFIYWATVSPGDIGMQLPYMIGGYDGTTQSPDPESIVIMMLQRDAHVEAGCNTIPDDIKLCTDYTVTLVAEDLLGGKSIVSDPVAFKIGVPAGTKNSWVLGEPLNCDGYDAGVYVDSGWDAGWADSSLQDTGLIDSGSVYASLDGGMPVDGSVSDAGSGGGGAGCSCSNVGL